MFYRFGFEHEIYPSLSQIPLHLRMKLDLTGVKLTLNVWLALTLEEREVLCHLPVDTEEERRAFTSYIDFLCFRHIGERVASTPRIADAPWEDLNCVPDSMRAKTQGAGETVTLEEWTQWNRYQRYALFKLSISKNEPNQFYEALREFRRRAGSPSGALWT